MTEYLLTGSPSSIKAVFSADGPSDTSSPTALKDILARLEANPAVQRAWNGADNI